MKLSVETAVFLYSQLFLSNFLTHHLVYVSCREAQTIILLMFCSQWLLYEDLTPFLQFHE